MDYQLALTTAIAAAEEAGRLLLDEFHRPGGPRGAPGACPADPLAEELIRNRLEQAFSDHGIVGEELSERDRDTRDVGRHVWVIDPNDGTRAFQCGWRGSAVSIGLLRAGEPVLGVVYAYAAHAGRGDLIAWAEGGRLTRNGEPVAPAWPGRLTGDCTVLVSQDADMNSAANARLAAPARFRTVPGIAYRLALAAVGEGVAGVSLGGAVAWDVVAGHALLRGAGGELYRLGGEPVRYAADGGGRVGDCVGGAPEIASELAGRDWRSVIGKDATADEPYPLAIPRSDRICADPGLLERAQGCLLGQLAGDNLGALVEFSDAKSIARAWPSGPERLVDGGFWNIAAGQPTDDSELALMLARAILTVGGYDQREAASAYVAWLASRPFDVGGTIGASLNAGLRTGSSAGGRCEAVLREARRHTASQANGALMRIAPLGIYGHALADDRLADLARQDAELTHAHAVCQDANAAYAIAIAEAIRTGAAPRAVYAHALTWARAHTAPEVVESLEAAASRPPAATAPIGWVLVALRHAFHQLLHAPTPTDGIIATVRAGGDTDTTAAITGALLGAVHGINALPAQWVDRVRTCRPTEAADSTAHPRPRAFWPVDFETIAEQLVMLVAGGKR